MRLPFENDKKRIVLLDKDLKNIPLDDLKAFMKKVIGRHYENLKNRGSGWTFPAFQEPVFMEWMDSLDKKEDQMKVSKTILTESAIQCDQDDLLYHYQYRYDVDPALYVFARKWLE